jgi:outer membrane murein-binding lipoprotein Lpp
MTFKPAVWRPIAIALSGINLVAVGFAAAAAEGWHAGTHAALALAFGLWAQRMRPEASAQPAGGVSELEARLEALEQDFSGVRQELNEAQERLDFAERVLAQGAETRRLSSEP